MLSIGAEIRLSPNVDDHCTADRAPERYRMMGARPDAGELTALHPFHDLRARTCAKALVNAAVLVTSAARIISEA